MGAGGGAEELELELACCGLPSLVGAETEPDVTPLVVEGFEPVKEVAAVLALGFS